MDQSNDVRKAIVLTSLRLPRGRPSHPGEKTRVGTPVVILPPPVVRQDRPANEVVRVDPEEAEAYLGHLVAHLRGERKRRGLSLVDVSRVSGLDRGMLSKMEDGRVGDPTFSTLWRYASALADQPSLLLIDATRAAAEAEGKAPATPIREDAEA